MTSSTGLIAIQIGIMFALLFFILTIHHVINLGHFETIIENQETIITFLNNTEALARCQDAARMCVAVLNENNLEGGLWWLR